MQKEYTKDEEQRKLLLLLAVNAELQKEWERAAVYYEQLLLYAPEFAEGYGKYGLFLLRRGRRIPAGDFMFYTEAVRQMGRIVRALKSGKNRWKVKQGEGK